MPFPLVVVRAFGRYAPGDTIADEATINAVLGGEHADRVVAVAAPDVSVVAVAAPDVSAVAVAAPATPAAVPATDTPSQQER